MTNVSDDVSLREDRLNQILADYLLALETGQAPDDASWLEQHVEFAEELQEFLADKRLMDEITRSRVPAPPEAETRTLAEYEVQTIGSVEARAINPGMTAFAVPTEAEIGQFGDYELLEEIARGGMGVVFKARQQKLNRIVALKMILAGQLASEALVIRFYTEAEAAAALDHPGIVPIFEVGEHQGQHFFSMGFIQGESLADKVARGPLRPEEAARFTKKVAEAIAFAHSKGVIHRDLKPANVLVDADGQPKVTDFGLAKQADNNEGLTTAGQILGTPAYMPPEQAAGKVNEVGPLADVYSLGAILYCLLTGRPPFQAATAMDTVLQVLELDPVSPRRLNSEVPRDLETICLKCLRKEPAKRYESAAALAEDLGRWLNHNPILARPVGRIEKTWLLCRRKPAIASLCSALFVIIIAAAGLTYERQTATYAAGLVESLVRADAQQMPAVLSELNQYRRLSEPLIRRKLATTVKNSSEQLHLRIALVRWDDSQVEPLYEPLLAADGDQFPVLRDALAAREQRIADRLWEVLESGANDPQQRRLRAAGALATYDPNNERWKIVAPEVARQLVDINPALIGQWQETLRPVAKWLIDPLTKVFADHEQDELPRSLAASLLADYVRDDPVMLTRLIVRADPQTFETLLPALKAHGNSAVEQLHAVLNRRVVPIWNDVADPNWQEPSEVVRAAIDDAQGQLTDRFAYCQSMPWKDFLNTAEALRPCGYRPTRVRPWAISSMPQSMVERPTDPSHWEVMVAAVWMRDGKPWDLQTDVVIDQLPPSKDPAVKNGLVPEDVATWPSGDLAAAPRFLILWSEPVAAKEKRWLFSDMTADQLNHAIFTFSKEEVYSQCTIFVWTDAAGVRRYGGIWSNQGTPSEMEGAYPGFELVELPQWDVAVSPAATIPDPLEAHRQQLQQISNLPQEQQDKPEVRLARARSAYYLGQFDLAMSDLDYLLEKRVLIAPVFRLRVWTLASMGQTQRAREELTVYLQQQPDPIASGYAQVVAEVLLGQYDEASRALEASVAAATNGDNLYILACAASIASQLYSQSDAEKSRHFADRAFEMLEAAIARGFQDGMRMKTDAELAWLHTDSRFIPLVEKIDAPATYSAVWRSDPDVESRLLTGLSPEAMRGQSQDLVAVGYRPFAIAIDNGFSAAQGTLPDINGRITSSIIWHRPIPPSADKEALALEQAIASVALLRMTEASSDTDGATDETSPASAVWPLFQHESDPRVRSHLLHRLTSYGVDPSLVLGRLEHEPELSRRRALVLAIGEFAKAKLFSQSQVSAATSVLVGLYADEPDPGIHSASEWALRQLGEVEQVATLRGKLATGNVEQDHQWYVTHEGQQTLAVLQPQGDFLMGSPVNEPDRFQGPTGKSERRHRRRVDRKFAIGTQEVTVEQFHKFRPTHEFDRSKSREADAPANLISWYDAAEFCNWLSQQEGIPRDEWCYPEQQFAEGMAQYPNYLHRTGYRLPTDAEWEYSCRAGATTIRYFGDTDELMVHYAWFTENSHDNWMAPVGRLKPNDFGLFDMYGNVMEWCQNVAVWYPKDRPWADDSEQPIPTVTNMYARVLRGGQFMSHGSDLRSARTTPWPPQARLPFSGLRLARTMPTAPYETSK